jgi:hypothetical protein
MTKAPTKLVAVQSHRADATAVTGAGTNTAKTDAAQAKWRSGFLLVVNTTAEAADVDEGYTVYIQGRDVNTDSYVVIGTITIPRGETGVSIVDVPLIQNDLQVGHTATGTSPSMIYTAALVVTELNYAPGGDDDRA